jgi:capsular exopolysaccharide synthesis family protein
MKNELIIVKDPKSLFSEAIRTLRTNLQFSLVANNANVLMVTSSVPGEGKSFISSNLSAAFSMMNIKVLIVDCDMRKGRLHKIFEVSNEKGLSNLLLDEVKNYKKYVQKTKVDNVSVIPLGIVPPNPSELLNSDKFENLVNTLRDAYDLVILDTPPVGSVSDSLVIAKYVDEAIIVTSYKQTPMEDLNETKKALEATGVKIAGIVLNNMEYKKHSKYYYNKYYN